MKKFDFCIGNPPYQEEKKNGNETFSPPVYDKFIEAAYGVADKVEMIHPARFLFQAGRTPKSWNEKMLSDKHLKIKYFEPDATKIFHDTEIKGGIVVSYRDSTKEFGAIGIFTQYDSLNSIIHKVINEQSLIDVIYIQNRFNLEQLYRDYPECKKVIGSDGKDSRFEKNIFEKIPLFSTEKISSTDILTTGILNNKRTKRYLPRLYIDTTHIALDKYKVIVPVANGNGEYGATLGGIEILNPGEAFTRSFICIGAVNSLNEVNAIYSYLKTKFLRALLSVLKVTQMNNKDVWKYVPIQDFTNAADIDWLKPVSDIDRQLYRKYNLSQDEIDFIETHVKAMV